MCIRLDWRHLLQIGPATALLIRQGRITDVNCDTQQYNEEANVAFTVAVRQEQLQFARGAFVNVDFDKPLDDVVLPPPITVCSLSCFMYQEHLLISACSRIHW